MTPKHTPGPWIMEADDWPCIKDSSGKTSDISDVAYVNDAKEDWVGEPYNGEPRAKYNAFLICASPDLLACLKDIVDQYDDSPGDCLIRRDSIDDARDAIRRAEGGE